MNSSSETNLADLATDPRSTGGGALRRIFVGDQGIRPGWSVLLFAAIYLILDRVATAGLSHFMLLDQSPIPLSHGFFGEGIEILVVLIATWVMARIENRPLFSYGYTGGHRAIRLVTGILWGFLCLSAVIGILWKAGLLVFEGLSLTGFTAWKYAMAWALVFLLVGVFEESLLRGYAQYTLARGIAFWWAALVLSVAFLLGHAGNGGESALGLLEVGLAGFVFCLSLYYTKSLWWAVGFHAGWDWAESYVYGTPDSGLIINGHLLASHPAGNPRWSGGTTGPEGSILILPVLIMAAIGMWLWWGVGNRTAQ